MTKQKSNSVVTTEVSEDQSRITFRVAGAGEIVLDLSKMNSAILTRARTHGFIQKVSDRAAIPFNKEQNRYATPQEKFAAMQELVDHFHSGTSEWAMKREGGVGRKPGGLDGILLAAVAEVTGKTVAEVRAIVESGAKAKEITQAQFLAALSNAAKVKPVVERMRAEQAASADLDGDELLEGLGE